MKYAYADSFEINGINLKVEILGCFTGGQRRQIMVKEDSYKVLINGVEMECVTESNLELLVKASLKGNAQVLTIPPAAINETIPEKKKL